MAAGAHNLGNIRDGGLDVHRLYVGARHHDIVDRHIADTQDVTEQRQFLGIVAVVFKLDQFFDRVAQIVGITTAARQPSPQIPNT